MHYEMVFVCKGNEIKESGDLDILEIVEKANTMIEVEK